MPFMWRAFFFGLAPRDKIALPMLVLPPQRFLIYLSLFFAPLLPATTLPQGYSLVYFPVETSTLIGEVFGDDLPKVSGLFGIDARSKRWSGMSQTTSSDPSLKILTRIEPLQGYFLNLNQKWELSERLTSESIYPIRTGFSLLPIASNETLESLTHSNLSTRLFAIFGLHGNNWQAYFHDPTPALGKIENSLFSSSSVQPLKELSPSHAYFLGCRPLLKRLSVDKLLAFPPPATQARISFGLSLEPDGKISEKLTFLGRNKTNDAGKWSGDIFVPESETQIFMEIEGTQSSRLATRNFSGLSLLSPIFLRPELKEENLQQVNLTPFTTVLALDVSVRKDLAATELASRWIGPLFEEDLGSGFNPFSKGAYGVLSAGWNNSSFQGYASSQPETSAMNIIHQVMNTILSQSSQDVFSFISDYGKGLQSPSLVMNSQINIIRTLVYSSLAENSLGIGVLLNQLNTLGGPNLNPSPENISDPSGILILNQIYLGSVPAVIESIQDNEAIVVPLTPSNGFQFQDFPDALKIVFSPLNPVQITTPSLTVVLENPLDPENHFARVTLNTFRIEMQDKHRIYVEFPQGEFFDFSFSIPGNQVPKASGSSPNKTLDSGDYRLGLRSDSLEVPIKAYIDKADGSFVNLQTAFPEQINLSLEFTGTSFSMHGRSDLSFHKIRIENLSIK
jgi:hypothetical protein